MSAFWAFVAIASPTCAAIVGARIGWHWRDRDVIDLQLSVAHEIDSRHAMERAVDARTAITKTAILERDAAQAKLAEATVLLRTTRDGAEVAVAQAARWKSERDELQAKVERMTSNLRRGSKPKVAAQ